MSVKTDVKQWHAVYTRPTQTTHIYMVWMSFCKFVGDDTTLCLYCLVIPAQLIVHARYAEDAHKATYHTHTIHSWDNGHI